MNNDEEGGEDCEVFCIRATAFGAGGMRWRDT